MTYQDLIGPKSNPGSIHNFVNYRKVPVEVVLEEAQSLIYSRLRVREMRVSGTVSLAMGASFSDLPDRFLEPIALRDREGVTLIPNRWDEETYIGEAELAEMRRYDESGVLYAGIPCFVAIFDERYQFDVKAASARTYDHLFYQRPAALGPQNNTNWLTSRYPMLLRVACLAGAASFMKDTDEETKQVQKLDALCNAANAESDLSRAS